MKSMTFLLALLIAPAAWAQGVLTDNVAIVLDASGSMSSSMSDAQGNRVVKIDAAKAALNEVLMRLPKTTNVGLLVFSAANVGIGREWVYPLGPRNDAILKAAISLPKPGNGTPLGTYMKTGADLLLRQREKQFGYGTYRLLVVTDGEANNEPGNLVDRHTKDIMSRGITVDVIGVDMKARHTLATMVHSYRAANDPESLKRAISEVFAEVSAKKDDTASGEAFKAIESLPNEIALAMIQAISEPMNHHIGEKPPPKPVASNAAQQADHQQADRQQAQQPGPDCWKVGIVVLLIVVVVAIIIIIARQWY